MKERKGRFGTMKMLAVIGVLTGACLLFSVSAHAETVCEGNTENISQTILYEAVEKGNSSGNGPYISEKSSDR